MALSMLYKKCHRARLDHIVRPGHKFRLIPSANIERRWKRSIDPSSPRVSSISGRRQLEDQWFPVRIEHSVNEKARKSAEQGKSDRVRVFAPVRLMQRNPMRLNLSAEQQLIQTQSGVRSSAVTQTDLNAQLTQTGLNEQRDEPVNVGVPLNQSPVEPAGLIVLAICIVVSSLGTAYLVSHQKHRSADRQQCQRKEILALTVAQLLDTWIFGRAFHTAVPAQVVGHTVMVVFAIGFIVFLIVRHLVVQRETVMTCNKVDALLRVQLLVAVNIRAAQQPLSQTGDRAAVASYKVPDVVAKPSVPLMPAVSDKSSDL